MQSYSCSCLFNIVGGIVLPIIPPILRTVSYVNIVVVLTFFFFATFFFLLKTMLPVDKPLQALNLREIGGLLSNYKTPCMWTSRGNILRHLRMGSGKRVHT